MIFQFSVVLALVCLVHFVNASDGCTSNADCKALYPGEKPVCDAGTGTCHECKKSKHCDAGEVCNKKNADWFCSQCANDNHCINLAIPELEVCNKVTGECECNTGYTSDCAGGCEDIDECQSEHFGNGDPCHSYGDCHNTDGSYTCVCGEGYEGDGYYCEDFDECARYSNICGHPDHVEACHDTHGDYWCECEEGYEAWSGTCQDVDECNSSTWESSFFWEAGCDDECVNTDGHFDCICGEGTYESGWAYGQPQCSDINECSYDNVCPEGRVCQNNYSHYSCPYCLPGHTMDVTEAEGEGAECYPVSYCNGHDGDLCGDYEDCHDTTYGFYCSCQSGFEQSTPFSCCEDVNECDVGVEAACGNPGVSCHNENGTYVCNCAAGYIDLGNGDGCEDINECNASPDPCKEVGLDCFNTDGSYDCGMWMDKEVFGGASPSHTCHFVPEGEDDEAVTNGDAAGTCLINWDTLEYQASVVDTVELSGDDGPVKDKGISHAIHQEFDYTNCVRVKSC